MKKFSLLLCCFVALLVSQKVMADADFSDYDYDNEVYRTLTISTSTAGQVSDMVSALTSEQKAAITKIVFDGKFSSADLSAVSNASGFTAVNTVDMSLAKFTKTYDPSTPPSSYLRYDVEGSLPSESPENPYVIVGGDVKRWTATRSWTSVGRQETYTEYATVAARDAATYTATVNSYARIPTDKHCQLNITTLNAGPTITTNEPSSFTHSFDYSDVGADITLIMADYTEWQTACFVRYYRWFQDGENGPKSWVECDEEYYNDADGTHGVNERIQCPDYADLLNLDADKYGHAGSVMRVYVYSSFASS